MAIEDVTTPLEFENRSPGSIYLSEAVTAANWGAIILGASRSVANSWHNRDHGLGDGGSP